MDGWGKKGGHAGGRTEQSGAASGGQDASTRLLSTLLTEMDGLESATGGTLLMQAPAWCSFLGSLQLSHGKRRCWCQKPAHISHSRQPGLQAESAQYDIMGI